MMNLRRNRKDYMIKITESGFKRYTNVIANEYCLVKKAQSFNFIDS